MRRLLPLGAAAAAAAQVTLWRNCHGPVAAYAGAWLARRDLFQETAFGDSLGMEYHDYNVYHQGGNGRPRVALKSARATDFYVEHLSEYEHAVRRRARDPEVLIRRQAEDAARACDEPRAAADYPAGAAPPLVLIPFWGGLPQKGGNAHSKVSVEEKLLQLRGVACSVRNTFPGAALVVGVASAADEAYVAGAVNASEVLRLDVAHGAHLSFTLFRRVQELIDAGRGRYARVDYVFFTEADQVLRAALSPRALVAALGRQVYVVPNRLEEPFPAGTSKDYATPQGRRLRFGQNMCNGELVATSDGRAAPAPPHHIYRAGRRNSVRRGGGDPLPWRGADRRPPVSRDELEGVVRAVRAFGRAPYAGSSRERRLRSAAEALGTTFGRCWAVAEKRAQAWFAQRDAVKAADFGRVRQPLKDLSQLSEAIDALKWSPAWHVWALAPANASFSVCHRCRAAAACAFEAPVARTRRNATDLVALLALPLDEDLEPALVRRSVCAARRAFGGVVVGVCDGADLRALDLLDDAEDGVFDATALPDGVFVVPLPCAAAPRAQTSARHVDHAAAAPLVKWAHAQVKGDAAAWRGLFFAAVGDVVAVRDVDALAAAAAPTTFVVPHRLRDGAARHNKRPPCDARERDWVTPLADPGRGDARRDLTAYHVVPR